MAGECNCLSAPQPPQTFSENQDGHSDGCFLNSDEFLEFLDQVEGRQNLMTNNEKRKLIYQFAARSLGYFGKRFELPKCVVGGVRDLFPADDGKYMGFKQT